MYPASRESAAFGDQAMMRFAHAVPNNLVRSRKTSFPTRVYSMPINRCVIRALRRKLKEERLSFGPAKDLTGLDENLPSHSSHFVGQGDNYLVPVHALFEPGDPSA
jgi:hypothetical protein